ncbi:mechanosensitive ion channel family protein [Candidatus Woesearchaeota archaeon]|nr:mechanosensitive ion channel family protein [Candidatus Woesearchaeota archaeon]
MAIEEEFFENLATWFSDAYTKFTIAFVILLIGFVIGKLAGKLVAKVLRKAGIDTMLKKKGKGYIPVEQLLASAVSFLLYFLSILMALNQLQITLLVLQLLLATAVLVILILILFVLKDFVYNAAAGMQLWKRKSLRTGKRVAIMGVPGTIMQINLVETKIRTKAGDLLYIPNEVLRKMRVEK